MSPPSDLDFNGSAASSCATAAPAPHRVLIIDDTPAIHDDIRKVLSTGAVDDKLGAFEEKLFGSTPPIVVPEIRFEIDSAYQGRDGVQRVEEARALGRPYAVAFVDMRMPPGDDGLQTIRALWRVDPQLQIVICSAYSDYSWNDIVAATGETDQLVILRKPVDNIEVLQLTHALAKKWELHHALQQHVERLELLVDERSRELGEKQAMFQLILENVTDLIAVVDANGKRIYNSPSYRTVLGYEVGELSETHAFSQIHPDDIETMQVAVDKARATGRGELVVYRMRHRDGSWRTLESCAGVVRGATGQLAYFVVVARDITQRRELELTHQLGQKLESIGRLAAGIAHEINTPTQYITDNTRFLADAFGQLASFLAKCRTLREAAATQPGCAEAARALAATEAEIELDYLLREIPRAVQQNLEGLARVARIVKSLKEFSHPNSPDLAPADLNHAITTAIDVCRHEWKYVADVVTELEPSLPPVPCVLDEVNQVILNLLVNAAHTIGEALKARGEKRGTITVRTRVEADTAVIEVSDTGMGIPDEMRPRIFEPFFTTKEVGKGTGQGLAIVHAVVVKHHHGKVSFTSEVGRGTTFCVRLPLVSTEVAA
jgi:PAS domain S-box-containing protein